VARRDGQEFDCATWLHKARSLPKDQFKREVEKELTGRETEPWEIIYFKLYKTRIPIVEQATETAALMLGTDKSRGYCLKMIYADFLAGANLDNGDPTLLRQSISRFFKFLAGEQRQAFLHEVTEKASWNQFDPNARACGLIPGSTNGCENAYSVAMAGDANVVGPSQNLEVHHKEFRGRGGDDSEENLITLCAECLLLVHAVEPCVDG
jgi:5-methylcytosine-specific restriction endonuclease McrA